MTTAAETGSQGAPGETLRRVPWAVAGLLLSVLLFSLGRLEIPGLLLGILVLLAALAVWRPATALLTLAAAIPIAAWAGRTWNPLVAWPEALAVAFLAGYCLRWALYAPPRSDRFSLPLLLMALLVIVSLAVQLTVLQWRVGTAVFRADLLQLVGMEYFFRGPGAVDAAMRLFESLLLFRAAASLAQTSYTFVPRLAASLVLGAAAAGALNLWRLWVAAQRSETPLSAFAGYVARVRLNVHYADLNAAGSFFILALIVATGLALGRGRRVWGAAVLPIAAGAWVTGSRAAFGGILLAALLPVGAQAWRLHPRIGKRTWAAAALLILFMAAVATLLLPERGNQARPATALQIRWELARTSLRMVAARPAFGIELGEYYNRSGEFSSMELLEIFPVARHENAHNNFLQILAELGVAGFAAFLWLLGRGAMACVRLLREAPDDPLRWALVTGLLAFVLTWLAGHPLLIDEPAFSFWLLFGGTAGWGLHGSSVQSRRPRTAWMVAALAAALVSTVPARVQRMQADADLDHAGIGLSAWQDALDGERYRIAEQSSTVFLPASVRVVRVPLRAIESGGELEVELRLDGRRADLVRVPADQWLRLRLVLPGHRDAPRFHRLDLVVRNAHSTAGPLLMIGKVEPL